MIRYIPNSAYKLTETWNNRWCYRDVVHSIVYNMHDVINSGQMNWQRMSDR